MTDAAPAAPPERCPTCLNWIKLPKDVQVQSYLGNYRYDCPDCAGTGKRKEKTE